MNYWGKAEEDKFHNLKNHLLDVAAVADVIIEKDKKLYQKLVNISPVNEDFLKSLILFFSAIHDLGKFSFSFQYKKKEFAEKQSIPRVNKFSTEKIHHTDLGLNFWLNQKKNDLEKFLGTGWTKKHYNSLYYLAQAAFGHHGKPAENTIVEASAISKNFNHGEVCSFVLELSDFFLKGKKPEGLKKKDFASVSWLVSGLITIADWIGSSTNWFEYCENFDSIEKRWEVSLASAEKAVKESGILIPEKSSLSSFEELFPHLKGFSPSPLQKKVFSIPVSKKVPSLHIFEDITGGGKTEAALAYIQKLIQNDAVSGFYIGLPTMATANSMYSRVSSVYNNFFEPDKFASIILSHSARTINEDFLKSIMLETSFEEDFLKNEEVPATAVCKAWLADHRKKSLLAAAGVGTIDQALLSVLPVKHQTMRLLGIARNVFVADEVHAYDKYTGTLLQTLIEFQAAMGSHTILLSATIPMKLKGKFIEAYSKGLEKFSGEAVDYKVENSAMPLITSVLGNELKTYEIDASDSIEANILFEHDDEAVFKRIIKAKNEEACCCWIRNTVNDALIAYLKLINEYKIPEEDIILFHARFTLLDRLNIENKVLELFDKKSTPEMRKGKILIATQVVEQSLDLDFDILFTDLAPMELIIQRLGRCHRHKRKFRPNGYEERTIVILSPEIIDNPDTHWFSEMFPSAEYVYPDTSLLWKTAKILKVAEKISLPENSRFLVEKAYEDFFMEELLEKESQIYGKEMAQGAFASRNRLVFEAGYDVDSSQVGWNEELKTPTRLGIETVRVRLLKKVNDNYWLWAGEDENDFSVKACVRSELSVNRNMFDSLPEDTDEDLKDLKLKMQDKAKFVF